MLQKSDGELVQVKKVRSHRFDRKGGRTVFLCSAQKKENVLTLFQHDLRVRPCGKVCKCIHSDTESANSQQIRS